MGESIVSMFHCQWGGSPERESLAGEEERQRRQGGGGQRERVGGEFSLDKTDAPLGGWFPERARDLVRGFHHLGEAGAKVIR